MSKIHYCLTIVGTFPSWEEFQEALKTPVLPRQSDFDKLKDTGTLEIVHTDVMIKASAIELKGRRRENK